MSDKSDALYNALEIEEEDNMEHSIKQVVNWHATYIIKRICFIFSYVFVFGPLVLLCTRKHVHY